MSASDESLISGRKHSEIARSVAQGAAEAEADAEADAEAEETVDARSTDRWLLRRIASFLGDPPVEFAVRGGARVPAASAPVGRVTFASRATLVSILADPWVRFGDAYSDGSLTVDGDLVEVLEVVYRASTMGDKPSWLRRAADLTHRPHVNTLRGSRDNIHHHYDIGNEFYSLWLGDTMAYTCAYYPTPTATLDEAQTAKMHHVCRKVRLKAGESVVEAGCGWGTLALHMARHCGVRVRAFNISHQQVAYARERAAREGLAGQVEYVEDDYRNISGHYDAFVSVGMLEHVGVKNYPTLGRIARRCLGGNGRGLIHSIGRNQPARLQPWIERRIFPGAYAPSLGEMAQIFEPWDLSVLDVENLRLHYAQTLRHWLALYETAGERVRAMFDEKFVRMWRLYLAGSVAAFSTGTLQLFQVVFATADNNDVPWTRAHLYTP
ncbi:MAG TPA: cyclopropane-fatty-acyl-phospholipid synthase family protein [Steroidobacteraceae bacterium]|nr:cyclopropane-fatty-acyl-phospholipid synthase family protein [Steroidobacteraceae bacterium]